MHGPVFFVLLKLQLAFTSAFILVCQGLPKYATGIKVDRRI